MHGAGRVRAADFNLSLAHHGPQSDMVDGLPVFGHGVIEIACDLGAVENRECAAAVAPGGLEKGPFAYPRLKMNLRVLVALTHDWKPLPSDYVFIVADYLSKSR